MTLELRHLRVFMAVVEAGSLGRAVATAKLTQPALSRIIRDMELRLGTPLFERHTRGVTLTAAGAALVPHARLLLFEARHALEAVEEIRGLRRGVLRIGAGSAFAQMVLPTAIETFMRRYPHLNVQLMEATGSKLASALTSHEIDLAVLSDLADDTDIRLIGELKAQDHYVVVCGKKNPLYGEQDVMLDTLLEGSWIAPPAGQNPRVLFEAFLRRQGSAVPLFRFEAHDVGAIKAIVASTDLLARLPRSIVGAEVAAGWLRVIPCPELDQTRKFFVMKRVGGVLPLAAIRFLDTLSFTNGSLLAPRELLKSQSLRGLSTEARSYGRQGWLAEWTASILTADAT